MHNITSSLAQRVTSILASSEPKLQHVSNDSDLTGHVVNILNGVVGVLSFACVAVIIVGGVQYMTSAGETQKTEKGKKTIIYGLVGLAICALSFAIVNFVIKNIIG